MKLTNYKEYKKTFLQRLWKELFTRTNILLCLSLSLNFSPKKYKASQLILILSVSFFYLFLVFCTGPSMETSALGGPMKEALEKLIQYKNIIQ